MNLTPASARRKFLILERLNVRPFARFGCVALAAVLCVLACADRAGAVILMDKADRNARPPHGSLVGSGWQWQGQFGAFLGTPIARN